MCVCVCARVCEGGVCVCSRVDGGLGWSTDAQWGITIPKIRGQDANTPRNTHPTHTCTQRTHAHTHTHASLRTSISNAPRWASGWDSRVVPTVTGTALPADKSRRSRCATASPRCRPTSVVLLSQAAVGAQVLRLHSALVVDRDERGAGQEEVLGHLRPQTLGRHYQDAQVGQLRLRWMGQHWPSRDTEQRG